ncbi:SCO family protein [Brumimicrobium oceani]|uniref:SCO family protein n=1 Tax=Brumimicrobium oceani TaxID=2100725 RepID=A0A2U2XBD3_9FLAO|nr:SCO family protein [Brumimicrobium oceani]PWH85105.1 SCO family protein [Brumimicrobium oceani]
MIKMPEIQTRKSRNLIFTTLFLFSLFTACSNDKAGQNSVNLPYIGHHDVVYEAVEGYEIGDTIFHKVPKWEYLTQDSTVLSSQDIDNKVWIVDFFFSYCPTICPPMTKAMRGISDSLSDYSEDFNILSFSIDPDRDTPARLRLYRKRHEVTSENWFFLTGDEEETHTLGIEGFQIHANADEQAPGGFAHSSNFVLIDKNQHIRGVYDGLEPESREQLIIDAKKLLNAN